MSFWFSIWKTTVTKIKELKTNWNVWEMMMQLGGWSATALVSLLVSFVMLCILYRCKTESTTGFHSWSASCILRTMLPSMDSLHTQPCRRKAGRIIKDPIPPATEANTTAASGSTLHCNHGISGFHMNEASNYSLVFKLKCVCTVLNEKK